MATTRQRVDRNTFKQIFRDHWGPFQQGHPRYQDRHVQAVLDKMLGCGTPESGYTTYLCPHCLEEKRVAFSCNTGACEALRALLHQSPRTFGQPTSRWTLALAAKVSFAQGLTPRLVSAE